MALQRRVTFLPSKSAGWVCSHPRCREFLYLLSGFLCCAICESLVVAVGNFALAQHRQQVLG